MRMYLSQTLLLCSLLTFFGLGHAEEKFTPIGAIAGGNATGEIPALDNGSEENYQCPQDYQNGDYLPNPYSDEKPLFRIDHTNVDQYRDRLRPGQIARFKRNKNFFMNIYPSHRNMVFSNQFYTATEKTGKNVMVDENGILRGYVGGLPFPHPQNGLEAIWNIKRPYVGNDLRMVDCQRIVTPSGKIKKSLRTTLMLIYDERRMDDNLPNPDKVSYKIKSFITYPADAAGTVYLTIGYLDERRREDTWLYLPALRRVRRAPTFSGGAEIDGESTMDEQGSEFRGLVNDWSWKLLGRREMYIPYNNYDIWKIGATDENECHAGDINPARIRYELHRVRIIEGIHQGRINHPYSKRVGFYDEDTWLAIGADRYDRRGNLWRTLEWYTAYNYCQKVRSLLGTVYINLESGRYELFGGCRTPKTRLAIINTGLKESDFSVQSLRKGGR